jgi:hypothetical protein
MRDKDEGRIIISMTRIKPREGLGNPLVLFAYGITNGSLPSRHGSHRDHAANCVMRKKNLTLEVRQKKDANK